MPVVFVVVVLFFNFIFCFFFAALGFHSHVLCRFSFSSHISVFELSMHVMRERSCSTDTSMQSKRRKRVCVCVRECGTSNLTQRVQVAKYLSQKINEICSHGSLAFSFADFGTMVTACVFIYFVLLLQNNHRVSFNYIPNCFLLCIEEKMASSCCSYKWFAFVLWIKMRKSNVLHFGCWTI